ncbi:MAG: hypothetical protein Satyrvirus8_10 [Satyrvirus sp.]|uniref:Uncharacterized protein n=1 Tax=Satyrvirus sp. TaxID=2487771 RepID=A0A3G5ADI9_9VIRU|nr:MAG: hypothetical protein Satyrvirus8_10 [Satyrvirus sp.]
MDPLQILSDTKANEERIRQTNETIKCSNALQRICDELKNKESKKLKKNQIA